MEEKASASVALSQALSRLFSSRLQKIMRSFGKMILPVAFLQLLTHNNSVTIPANISCNIM